MASALSIAFVALALLTAPAIAAAGPPAVTGLTSPTHPDPATAYPNADPAFTWNTTPGTGSAIAGYSFVLDQVSGTVPDASVELPAGGYDQLTGYGVEAPCWIATADFDADGVEDVAVANMNQPVVSVFLGDGDGTLGDRRDVATAPGANSVVAADFDGDGIVDLATGSSDETVVSVLLGNGDGTFQPRITTSTDDGGNGAPYALAAGDFNEDGKVDLAAGARGTSVTPDYLIVLLGRGDGTFARRVVSIGNVEPVRVKPVDLDRDGNLDIVMCYWDSHGWAGVLRGRGDGTFATMSSFATLCNSSLDVADLDGDSLNDIVVAGGGGGDVGGTVSVLINRGGGTFAPHAEYATGPAAGADVVVADLDDDGVPDLVVTNPGSRYAVDYEHSVSVLRGYGDGSFAFHADYHTNIAPVFAAVADLDRDGRQDVLTADRQGDCLSLFRGRGDGTLAACLMDGFAWDPTSVAIADFDLDGAEDVAIVNAGDGSFTVFPGRGDGTFAHGIDSLTDGEPYYLVSADFDGDGTPDVAAADVDNSTLQVLLGVGDGTFSPHVDYSLSGARPYCLTVGDVDADGAPDLAVGTYYNARVFMGRGDGTFAAGVDNGLGSTPSSFTVGDFNNDGKLDIVGANEDVLAPISILVGNGDGTFGAYVEEPVNEAFTAVAAADFDGDGLLDLAMAVRHEASVAVLRGTGDTFVLSDHFQTASSTQSLLTGDFNADGLTDLAAACSSGSFVTLLLGNGDGTLGARMDFGVGTGAGLNDHSLAVGDLNGDGLPDLATANVSSSSMSALLHTPSTTAEFFDKAAGTWYFHIRAVDATGAVGPTVERAVKIGGAPKPVITTLTPDHGVVDSQVTITGSDLGTGGTVFFGGTVAPVQSWSATSVVCRVPAALSAGFVDVTVASGGQTSNALPFAVDPPPPALSSLAPTSGAAGSAVTLYGTGLGSSGVVRFGTTPADTQSWTATQIGCTVPSLTAGSYPVTVETGGQTSNGLAFTVTEVPPDDLTPPVTTASGYDDAWHASPVTVTFGAVDPGPNASGVAYTEWRLDAGAWTRGTSCTVPAPASTQHVYTVGYRSVDNANNTEVEKTVQVKIDTTVPPDLTPPVMSFSCPHDLAKWHNHDLAVTFTVTDAGSGPDAVLYAPGDSPTWLELDLSQGHVLPFPAEADHSWDGDTEVSCKARDKALNESAVQSFHVKIDTRRPTGKALYAVTVRKGRTATLKYRVNDLAPNGGTATAVTIKIKNRAGKVVKTIRLGARKVNTTYSARFTCKLPKGSYRWYVSGRDAAGNAAKVGSNRLTVK